MSVGLHKSGNCGSNLQLVKTEQIFLIFKGLKYLTINLPVSHGTPEMILQQGIYFSDIPKSTPRKASPLPAASLTFNSIPPSLWTLCKQTEMGL